MTAAIPHADDPLMPRAHPLSERRPRPVTWAETVPAPAAATHPAAADPLPEARLTVTPVPAASRMDQHLLLVDPGAVPSGAVVLAVLVLTAGGAGGDRVVAAPTHSAVGGPTPTAVDHPRPAAAVPARPGLVIDEGARRALVDGQELQLTRREFDLLLHLWRHPGRVHTRERLLQTIWGRDDVLSHPGRRTVDVHVARLRRKLGPGQGDRLETLRGIGYRWSGRGADGVAG